MPAKSLDHCRGDRSRQIELIEQKHYVCISPFIGTDARSPVNRAQFSAFDVPFIPFNVTRRITKSWIASAPVRNLLLIEKGLLADDESPFAGLHVRLDSLNHRSDVAAHVRSLLEILRQVDFCVLRQVNDLQFVVARSGNAD